MNTPQSPAKVEVERLPELPAFSQLIGHMLRDYVPASVELQVAVAIREYAKAYATEAIAAERAEVERLRAALKVSEQAVREMSHAHFDPNWFTDGKAGADKQFRLWSQKAREQFAALATPTQGAKS